MRSLYTYACLCLLLVSMCQTAYSAVVIVVGNGSQYSFTAGTTAAIPIFAYNNGASAISASSFGLGLDFSVVPDGNDGFGVPGTPDYFTPVDFVSSTFTTSDGFSVPTIATNTNYDVRITASKTSAPFVSLPANGSLASAVQLGTLTFDIKTFTPSGTFGLKFVPNATQNGFSVNTFTTNPTLLAGTGTNRNQFSVTAVPEPGTWMLIGSSGAFFVTSYLRRRRLAKKENAS